MTPEQVLELVKPYLAEIGCADIVYLRPDVDEDGQPGGHTLELASPRYDHDELCDLLSGDDVAEFWRDAFFAIHRAQAAALAEAEARENRLREAAEGVIYRADERGLFSTPLTDLQIALRYLQAALKGATHAE